MSWVTVGITAASALASGQKAKNQNENMRAKNLAESEKTRYSAWSGLGGGDVNTNFEDPGAAALSGGLGGLAAAQGLGAFGKTGSPSAPMGGAQGGSYLGGNQMAAQMSGPQSNWNFMPAQNEFAVMAPQQMNAPMGPYRY